ncbi:MAG: HPr family phosphocarrier protein [Pirellulales bacterium]|nr:HPr family phosphocarrier protein [Pirellulales bacterium]
MSEPKLARTVTVVNREGVHARAATLVAGTVRRFQSKVELIKSRHRVDGTDVLQILSLGAAEGEELQLEAAGPDAAAALDALVELFRGKFGENAEADKQEK